jgi:peptide/nickel transport system permease protein
VFRYFARRTIWAIGLFLVVTVVTYVIFFVIPVDPAKQACGQRATQTCIRLARHTLGLDKPLVVQYGRFLWRLTYYHDLGRSFVSRQSVNKTVLNAAPVTASVAIGGLLVMLLIAFPVGILSALRPRSKLDRGAMTFTLASISLPTFWVGLVAAYYIRMIRATLMEAMAEDYAALDSITTFDLPVTMGVVIFGTLTILIANLIVDLLYAVIDPRIRLA